MFKMLQKSIEDMFAMNILVEWKYSGSASHQSKSPRPVTLVTCHVIEAWSLDAEPLIFPSKPGLLPWQEAPLPLLPRNGR